MRKQSKWAKLLQRIRVLGTGTTLTISTGTSEREYCLGLVRQGYLEPVNGQFKIIALPKSDINVSDFMGKVYPGSRKWYKTGSGRGGIS